jgi:cell division ATPase FtsA
LAPQEAEEIKVKHLAPVEVEIKDKILDQVKEVGVFTEEEVVLALIKVYF